MFKTQSDLANLRLIIQEEQELNLSLVRWNKNKDNDPEPEIYPLVSVDLDVIEKVKNLKITKYQKQGEEVLIEVKEFDEKEMPAKDGFSFSRKIKNFESSNAVLVPVN